MTNEEKLQRLKELVGERVWVNVETDPFDPKRDSDSFVWIKTTFEGVLRTEAENGIDRFYVTPENGAHIIDFSASLVNMVSRKTKNISIKI